MAVAAIFVVAGDHIRAALPHQAHESPGGLVQVGLVEAVGVIIGRRSRHAGVAVVEQVKFRHLKLAARLLELCHAHLAEFRPHLVRVHFRVDNFAFLASRGRDQDGVDALLAVARQAAAGTHAFVIRMGMHRHQGQSFGHPSFSFEPVSFRYRNCRLEV